MKNLTLLSAAGALVSLATTAAGQPTYKPYSFTTLVGKPPIVAEGSQFVRPEGIAVDAAGNVHVADTFSQTIRKIAPDGVVTILAGAIGSRGPTDGVGGNARFDYPYDVVVESAGTVYVSHDHRERGPEDYGIWCSEHYRPRAAAMKSRESRPDAK